MADRGGSAPHTAGEWEIVGSTHVAKFGHDWAHIAVVCSPRGPDGNDDPARTKAVPVELGDPRFHEACANARLIAAAPDMEAALQRMLNSFSSGDLCIECGETEGSGKGCDCCYVIEQAEAALRKARGE